MVRGPDDQLVRATVDGRPAVITNTDSNTITVSDVRPTDIGFTPQDAQVTINDPGVHAGLDVPVTLAFAHRGDLHITVPVLTSAIDPGPVTTSPSTPSGLAGNGRHAKRSTSQALGPPELTEPSLPLVIGDVDRLP